jgi:hypothetical protein
MQLGKVQLFQAYVARSSVNSKRRHSREISHASDGLQLDSLDSLALK